MALTLSAIRVALANQIRDGLVRKPNVQAYDLPKIVFPTVVILPAEGEYATYTQTFDGIASVDLVIEVRIAAFDLDQQIAMDDYLSAGVGNGSSIIDAVHTDDTLDGLVEFCTVHPAQGPVLDEERHLIGRIPITISCQREI